MVKKMNNKQVMKKVQEELKLDEKSLLIFSNIVNDIPIIGKKNKSKMTSAFIEQLNVNEETAEKYYETFSKIITTALKDKLKHPFRNLDKEDK